MGLNPINTYFLYGQFVVLALAVLRSHNLHDQNKIPCVTAFYLPIF